MTLSPSTNWSDDGPENGTCMQEIIMTLYNRLNISKVLSDSSSTTLSGFSWVANADVKDVASHSWKSILHTSLAFGISYQKSFQCFFSKSREEFS